MNQQKYLEDLKDIKDIMNRSSRFISLSGYSGIAAGLIAMVGSFLAYQTIYANQSYFGYRKANLDESSMMQLLLIASLTLITALAAVIFFTTRETRKQGEKIWDQHTKRLLINLAIPLVTGGLVCLSFLLDGRLSTAIALTLIFYGLSLVNASKYTITDIRSLGLIQIVLGLICIQFDGLGLLLWTIGFGVMHVIYGFWMQLKTTR